MKLRVVGRGCRGKPGNWKQEEGGGAGDWERNLWNFSPLRYYSPLRRKIRACPGKMCRNEISTGASRPRVKIVISLSRCVLHLAFSSSSSSSFVVSVLLALFSLFDNFSIHHPRASSFPFKDAALARPALTLQLANARCTHDRVYSWSYEETYEEKGGGFLGRQWTVGCSRRQDVSTTRGGGKNPRKIRRVVLVFLSSLISSGIDASRH